MTEPEEIRLWLPADGSAPPLPQRTSGRPGVPVRWCALLAVLLLGLAAGAGALLRERRQASRTVTTVRYLHPAGVDLTGCPRGDTCVPLREPGVPAGMPGPLRDARVVAGSSLLDASTSQTVRAVEVLVLGRLRFAVTTQCMAGAAAVAARELTSPGMATFVRPGAQPGCSVGVVADAPAGTPLPMTALRQLAADPNLQLSP